MKNALYIALFILVFGNISHFGVPWWVLVPLAALAGWLFPVAPGKSFSAAFGGGMLLWFWNAFLQDSANEGLLSAKIGLLFQGLEGWHLLLLTGVLGGLSAGLGALTGRLGRNLFVGQQPNP